MKKFFVTSVAVLALVACADSESDSMPITMEVENLTTGEQESSFSPRETYREMVRADPRKYCSELTAENFQMLTGVESGIRDSVSIGTASTSRTFEVEARLMADDIVWNTSYVRGLGHQPHQTTYNCHLLTA